MNLFVEREKYDALIINSENDRKKCYYISMLCIDGSFDDYYSDDHSVSERLSEKNFFTEHYEWLIQLFPRAKNLLDKNKFMED